MVLSWKRRKEEAEGDISRKGSPLIPYNHHLRLHVKLSEPLKVKKRMKRWNREEKGVYPEKAVQWQEMRGYSLLWILWKSHKQPPRIGYISNLGSWRYTKSGNTECIDNPLNVRSKRPLEQKVWGRNELTKENSKKPFVHWFHVTSW